VWAVLLHTKGVALMSTSDVVPGARGTQPTGPRVVPSSATGWWATGLTVLGLAAWVILPIVTTLFRETYPLTDTVVMPVIGVVLIGAAAAFNLLSVLRWRQRSVLNIIAMAITVPAALFFTFMVVGEGLAGL